MTEPPVARLRVVGVLHRVVEEDSRSVEDHAVEERFVVRTVPGRRPQHQRVVVECFVRFHVRAHERSVGHHVVVQKQHQVAACAFDRPVARHGGSFRIPFDHCAVEVRVTSNRRSDRRALARVRAIYGDNHLESWCVLLACKGSDARTQEFGALARGDDDGDFGCACHETPPARVKSTKWSHSRLGGKMSGRRSTTSASCGDSTASASRFEFA